MSLEQLGAALIFGWLSGAIIVARLIAKDGGR
jgi:hypothetical protein